MTSSVVIVEVGPRDGFQSITAPIPTIEKIEIIEKLYAAGIRRIEIGSFVSRAAVPQFADIMQVLDGTRALQDLDAQLLVPTERRADEAIAAGVNHLVFVLSLSDRHNHANVRRSCGESVVEYRNIVKKLPPGVKMRLNLATAFDCPYEGRKAEVDAIRVLDELVDILPTAEIALCDTTGRVGPDHVQSLTSTCLARYSPVTAWAFHAHDTYGLGLANVFAAWREGISIVDASIAGLGGCPFAPGATGNVATEDVVWLFDRMGVTTAIDVERLVTVAQRASALPGAQVGGRVRNAMAARCG